MSDELQIQPLIKVVNEETRNRIIALDQRLRVLRNEVASKLMYMALYRGEDPETYKNNLLKMQHDLTAALDSISALVNIVVPPGQENNPILHGELMDDFTAMITESLENFNNIE